MKFNFYVEHPPTVKRELPVPSGIVKATRGFIAMAALLFLSAGTVLWPAAWIFLGIHLAAITLNLALLSAHNPDLIADRSRFVHGAPTWDRYIDFLLALGAFGLYVIAGLERRFAGNPSFSRIWQIAGLVLILCGYALFIWAMHSNRFFSRVVRIQMERGHTVAEGGPYRFIRHPGYVGFIGYTLGAPLLLGSQWAFLPTGLTALAILTRTALEDRFLFQGLAGYDDYTRRVRWKLLPGVW
jgi:protein-S-isoprenylcysteine O-methyltransferase Ste14